MDNYDLYGIGNDKEDWISLTEPVYSSLTDESDTASDTSTPANTAYKNKNYSAPILFVQFTLIVLMLLIIFAAKFFLPEIFFKIKAGYDKEMSRSMLSEGDFSSFDYSSFFNSTDDEI